MCTPSPAAGAAHAGIHFRNCFLYSDISCFGEFARSHPADPFIAGEWSDVFPEGANFCHTINSFFKV